MKCVKGAHFCCICFGEPSPIYDRDTKNKAEELDRLYAAVKEKLVTTSNAEKLQILTLVPDSWSQKYRFRVFNSICKRTEANKGDTCTTLKKGKAIAQETIDLVHAFCEGDKYSR